MESIERTGLAEQTKIPERLSDEKLGNLISAVGNHEAKALLLGLMQPGIVYTGSSLHKLMLNAQGLSPGWRIDGETLIDYCKQSLAPIGLVAQEITVRGDSRIVGYIETNFGQEEGSILSGLLLDFSLRYPQISLQDIFSLTTSRAKSQEIEEGFEYKERPPITRLKIFWELITSHLPIRTVDLAESVGEEASNKIGRHLLYLNEKRILSYDAVGHGGSRFYYQFKENHLSGLPKNNDRRRLTQFVHQVLQQNPDQKFTIESMLDKYLKMYPGGFLKSLSNELSYVLSSLVRQGYAQRGKFNREKQSEVDLTNEQRQMLLDLVTILDQFQNQDSGILTYGKRCVQEITNDPEKVSQLMRKAWEHSHQTQRIPPEQTIATILTIISQKPGITPNQVRESLTQYQNRAMAKESLRKFILLLLKDGQITQKTVKGERHFSIASLPVEDKAS